MSLLNLDDTINKYLEIINKNILELYISIPENQLDLNKEDNALNGYVNIGPTYSLNINLLKILSGTDSQNEIFIVRQDSTNKTCKITTDLTAVSDADKIKFTDINTFTLQLYEDGVCMYLKETDDTNSITNNYYDLSKIITASLDKIVFNGTDKDYDRYFLMYVILKKIKDENYSKDFNKTTALKANTYSIGTDADVISSSTIVDTVNIINLINKHYYDKYELFIDCLYYYYTIILLEYNYNFVTKQLTYFESKFTSKNTIVYDDTKTTLETIFIDLLKIIHTSPDKIGLINSRILTESNFITKLLNIYGPASSNSSVNILGYNLVNFKTRYTDEIRDMYDTSPSFTENTMKNYLLAKTINYFCNNLSIKNLILDTVDAGQLISLWNSLTSAGDISSDSTTFKTNRELNLKFGTSLFLSDDSIPAASTVYNFLMSGGTSVNSPDTNIIESNIMTILDNNILKFLLYDQSSSDNYNYNHISSILKNATVNEGTDIASDSGLFKIITNAINTIGKNKETYFDTNEATSLPSIKNKIFQDIFKIHCKKVSTVVVEKVYDEINYDSTGDGSINISSTNTLPILLLHLNNSVTATPLYPSGSSSEYIFDDYDFNTNKINVSTQICSGTLKNLANAKTNDEYIQSIKSLYAHMTDASGTGVNPTIYSQVLTNYSITGADSSINTNNASTLYTKTKEFITEYDKVYELTKVKNELLRKYDDIEGNLDTEQIDGSQIKINDIKKELTTVNKSYKENVDKYKIKNNELNNILKNNLYNNIFLYITIVVLILICLGLIYINNHKASLKTQYSVMLIAFLLLYYIIYTNVTVNITETFQASETTIDNTKLEKLHNKIYSKLLLLSSSEKIYGEALKKEKNKYDGFAKSSNAKLNNLELVLNDEFINAIKSKELVKFLILFTAICIISYIVYTNTEDPTTTSIIFIILFVIILAIYFYNINLMTRTKADTKYWNHRMTMK